MNDAPKYQPTDDEPRFMVEQWMDDDESAWLVFFSDAVTGWDTRAEAEAEVQRVAIAIADRVHGAEMAALRAELERHRRERASDLTRDAARISELITELGMLSRREVRDGE